MSGVKRYGCVEIISYDRCGCKMEKSEIGGYVNYEDYLKLEQQNNNIKNILINKSGELKLQIEEYEGTDESLFEYMQGRYDQIMEILEILQ